MRLTRVLVLCVQKAAFCKESFVFICLTYRNVQCFRNWLLDEFHSLKASQMSKVRASSQECQRVEKIKNLHEQNFQGRGKQQAIGNWIVTILSDFSS